MFGAFWLKRARHRSTVLRQPVAPLGERGVVFLQLFAAGVNIGVAFGIVGEVAARKGYVPRISVEAPAERLAYAVLLSPDRPKQDALNGRRRQPAFGERREDCRSPRHALTRRGASSLRQELPSSCPPPRKFLRSKE